MSVSLHMLRVGSCRHLECMTARGGRLTRIDFPALCGLIHHPNIGWILYDTGYAEHFFRATEMWPERLYRNFLPVNLPPSEMLVAQLAAHGIGPEDISLVIVSHYHGDHIAGLRDFPKARFIALRSGTAALKALQGHRWRATINGQLPELLPNDFHNRLDFADDKPIRDMPTWMHPFTHGHDLFNDGTLLGVPLPGHIEGQLGLLIPDVNGHPVFLVADACWSMPACREGRLPSRITAFITANQKQYRNTFLNIRALAIREPSLSMLPSHCTYSWGQFHAAN